MIDHYSVLGIPQGSSYEAIKTAWRQNVKQHHPDAGGDGDFIVKVNNAWETLKDPAKRSEYDQKISSGTASRSDKESRAESSQQTSFSWANNRWGATGARRSQARSASNRSDQTARSSRGPETVRKDTFRRICTCGCKGYPLTRVTWTLNYSNYSTCPARKLRKRCGFYYSDSGIYVSWNDAKTRRWRQRNEARRNPEAAQRVKKEREASARAARNRAKEQVAKQEELERIKNRLEPLSPAEAKRRGLKYYRGKPCKYGHDSLRDLNSNCLRCREIERMAKTSARAYG